MTGCSPGLALSIVLAAAGGSAHAAGWQGEVDKVFADLARPGSAGCSVAVTRGDKIALSRAYGMANLVHGVPNTPETVFDTGSISKQFTAAAIILLVQDGRIDLDADVHKYLSDLPDYGKTVTVRHLLTHTGGIPDPYTVLEAIGGDESGNFYPPAQALRLLRRMGTLEFEPGARFAYSNAGYLLLAEIAEKVSGMSLRRLTSERLFSPLGMTRTFFRDNYREIIPKFAQGYNRTEPAGWEINDSNFDVVGDGGVVSTADDLARWHLALRDAKVPGGRAFVEMIEKPATYVEGPPKLHGSLEGVDASYGFGVMTWRQKDRKAVGHLGGWSGFSGAEARYPGSDFSVVTLCNVRSRDTFKRMSAVAEILMAEDPKWLDQQRSDSMAGLYANTLIVTLPNGSDLKVFYNQDRTFRYSNGYSGKWFRNDAGDLCQIDPSTGGESAQLCNKMRFGVGPGSSWEQPAPGGGNVKVRVIAGRSE